MIPTLGARGLAATVALLLLVLAACGGSTATGGDDAQDGGTESSAAPAGGGGDGGDGGVDLCAVLTLDEVSAAAGVEVVEGEGLNSNDVSSCNWNTADGTPVAGNTYTRGNEAIDPEQMIEANLGDAAEEISGLGERAVLVGDENFPIVMVLKNGALYSISVLADNLDGEGKRQASIDLARASVDRLP